MTQPPAARPRLRSATALATAVLLAFVACQLPRPEASPAPAPAESQQGVAGSSATGIAGGERAIVRLTSLGLEGAGSSFTVSAHRHPAPVESSVHVDGRHRW